MRFLRYINESFSRDDVQALEDVLNRKYHEEGFDLVLGKHFYDRVNDNRNRPPITFKEARDMLSKAIIKYADQFKKLPIGREIVVTDRQKELNAPIIFDRSTKPNMTTMEVKTIMRKKNFGTGRAKRYVV